MEDVGLIDERRDQLDNEREYTCKMPTRNGGVTSTRIDRWYIPETTPFLTEYRLDNNIVFKEVKPDHTAIWITLDTRTGEMGHDRKNLHPKLMDDPRIIQEIRETQARIYSENSGKDEIKKWSITLTKIFDILSRETKARKFKEKEEIRRLNGFLEILRVRHKKRGATTQTLQQEKKYHRQLYELKNPEMVDPPTATNAKYMYDKSE